jgi:hypothetical protein
LEFFSSPGHQLATCIAFDLALKPPPASVTELQQKAVQNAKKLKMNTELTQKQKTASFNRKSDKSPSVFAYVNPMTKISSQTPDQTTPIDKTLSTPQI